MVLTWPTPQIRSIGSSMAHVAPCVAPLLMAGEALHATCLVFCLRGNSRQRRTAGRRFLQQSVVKGGSFPQGGTTATPDDLKASPLGPNNCHTHARAKAEPWPRRAAVFGGERRQHLQYGTARRPALTEAAQSSGKVATRGLGVTPRPRRGARAHGRCRAWCTVIAPTARISPAAFVVFRPRLQCGRTREQSGRCVAH